MTRRGLSFGAVAEDYDRYRPGYPDAVVDLAVAHARGPVERAVEIGAGTGKATVLFASRGIDVTAVEPDAAMRAVLGRQTANFAVHAVNSTFEGLEADRLGRFDLLFSAAAFHWTDPGTRWERVAALVRPGGAVALFGSQTCIADPELAEHIEQLADGVGRDPRTAPDAANREPWTGWTADDLRERPELTDVVEIALPRLVVLSADHFVARLSTVSAYRVLADKRRAELLERIRSALPATVETTQDLVGHLARRV